MIIVKVIADLHIHSHYSRATSPRLTPPWLERWARIKGIGLLGTGDCTHPLWLEELRGQMDDAEEGFYTLKKEVRDAFDAGPAMIEGLPAPGARFSGNAAVTGAPRFILTGEISTIYKRGDKTRKIHHVIVLPDFKAAAAFNARLEGSGGNIRSDGRPILGMDSRDLLALLLETDERALLIPAHIWTPWFSALGEKSGFDSIEECYGDLAGYIPAVETGLSSNPPMNWALKSLDRFSIVSNSDAHSPDKLGREATILEMELSCPSLRKALCAHSSGANSPGDASPGDTTPGILGTVEFFPEEGKNHYDGHRKCGVSLGPGEAAGMNYLCPVCGKPLTRGVMGRLLELADRRGNSETAVPAEAVVSVDEPCPPDYWDSNRRPYYSLIPLREIAGELLGTGAASKRAEMAYYRLIEKGGSEFSILRDKSREELEKLNIPELSGEILATAILKMRAGDVSVSPGYDGEYGIIRVFAPGSAPGTGVTKGEKSFFGEPEEPAGVPTEVPAGKTVEKQKPAAPRILPRDSSGTGVMGIQHPAKKPEPKHEENFVPDADQERVVSYNGRETIIIAGPGTGKTRVLTERIARLIKNGADGASSLPVPPEAILALTFTVKAAAELRERTERLCGPQAVTAATFHSFCCLVLREHCGEAGLSPFFKIIGEEERDSLLREISGRRARRLGLYIEERKRFLLLPGEKFPKFANAGNVPALLRLTQGRDTGPERLWIRPREAGRDSSPDEWEFPQADEEMETLYGEYRQALKKTSRLDFEDLCAGTVRLLAVHPDILESYQRRFRYIFVDEYQDINFSQYLLIRLLAPGGAESPSLWVIGDPNQAIYGFRGADKRFINRFLSDYPEAVKFELSRSFRCAEPIISAAGYLTGTRLRGNAEGAGNKAGVSLYRTQYATEKSEAEGIARTIEALLGGTSFFALDSGRDLPPGNGNLGPGDCAVLVRAAALGAPIVKALKDHGIPFETAGAGPWWKEEPAGTIIDVLRDREKTGTASAASLSPAARIVEDTVSSPGDLVRSAWEELAKKNGYKKKKATGNSAGRMSTSAVSEKPGSLPVVVERLISLAGFFGDLSSFLDTLDSCAASGIPEPGTEFSAMPESGNSHFIQHDAVRIMTIHASKGLEFGHVFVAGLEEGILPFTLFDKPGEENNMRAETERLEEERRLLYVAMTRAKRGLWLSWADSRIYRGLKLNGGPSCFLSELEKIVPLSQQEKQRQWDGQLSLF